MQNKLFKKEEKQRYKLGQPELKNQIKQRDRLSDILRDLSSKESTLKSAKTELKTLKIQIGKLKTRTTDLKDKIGDLHKIIDSNPRAKRMLEQQKGELNQYKPQKTEFGRKSYENMNYDSSNYTLKEHNELLEQSITLKIELNKHKNKSEQLGELNIKLESEIEYYQSENARLNKRCENLIAHETDIETKRTTSNENKLKEQI